MMIHYDSALGAFLSTIAEHNHFMMALLFLDDSHDVVLSEQ